MNTSNKGAEDRDGLAKRKYIRWNDEGVEKIPPNEAEDIQAVADQINAIQKAMWNMHRHCYTGKLLICRAKSFIVLSGLQEPMRELRVSLKESSLLKMTCRNT